MKIGVNCPVCQADHWINVKAGKAKCGICHPAKVNLKREWPRMVKVWHHEFIRKDGTAKPPTMCAHRVTFSDYELAKAVAVVIEKVRAERGEVFYRVKPIMNSEFKTFEDAKRFFVRGKQCAG